MQRTSVRKSMIILAVLALTGLSIMSIALVAQARQEQRIAVDGQNVPLMRQAHLLGAANGQQELNLSIGLRPRNSQELDSLLNNLYDPRSSLYHHFLTPQEFAAEFGPTQEEQQQVVDYLRQQGLTVSSVSPNGLLIDASAT